MEIQKATHCARSSSEAEYKSLVVAMCEAQ